MRFSLLGLIIFLMTGCAGLPGYVSTSKSQFDGTTQVSMNQDWIDSRATLGLMWNSSLNQNELVMNIMVTEADSIDSFLLNIDDKKFQLTPIDQLTQHTYQKGYYTPGVAIPGKAWAAKRFTIDMPTLEQIIAAQKAAFKININREYVEGDLKDGSYRTTASIQEFVDEVKKQQNNTDVNEKRNL